MGYFDKEIRFIDELPQLINDGIREAFKDYGFVGIDYITNKQLFQKGEDAQGEKIQSKFLPKGIAYSSFTVKLKQKKRRPDRPRNMERRGEFIQKRKIRNRQQ